MSRAGRRASADIHQAVDSGGLVSAAAAATRQEVAPRSSVAIYSPPNSWYRDTTTVDWRDVGWNFMYPYIRERTVPRLRSLGFEMTNKVFR